MSIAIEVNDHTATSFASIDYVGLDNARNPTPLPRSTNIVSLGMSRKSRSKEIFTEITNPIKQMSHAPTAATRIGHKIV